MNGYGYGIECPYCGTESDVYPGDLDGLNSGRESVIECDNEECGKEYAVTADISYSTHKIAVARDPGGTTHGQ